jgi:hypothetical protein
MIKSIMPAGINATPAWCEKTISVSQEQHLDSRFSFIETISNYAGYAVGKTQLGARLVV